MRKAEASGLAPAARRCYCRHSPASSASALPSGGLVPQHPAPAAPSLCPVLREAPAPARALGGRMTELQSALLRRQLAGERAGGWAAGRAAIAASSCPLLPPPGRSRAGGAGRLRGAAGSGETGAGLREWGARAPVRAGPITSSLAFRVLGAGARPSLGPRTGPGTPQTGRGACPPSPTVRWDVAGEGLWVPRPGGPSLEGAGPGSGAPETAGPRGR